MSLNIQRNDQVEVISGADRGKRGRVLRMIPETNRILVEHVRVVKKNVRPNP
ncbi:MAG: 50S ribosomal protein L24, partial [Silvibacterium sp.]